MDLPEPVRQAADLADQMSEQIAKEAGETGAISPADNPQPVATEPVQVTEQQETQEQRPQVTEDDYAKVQSRYASLKGKYDAEVPRLHGENSELKNQIKHLAEANKALQDELAKNAASRTYLTKQDVETYGEDMISLVRRGAQEEAAKYARKAAELEARLQQMESRLQGTQQAAADSRKAEFLRALTAGFPEWEKYDKDEGFLDWLSKVEENFGFSRQEALDRAVSAGDGARAAKIFKAYADSLTPKQTPLARQVTPEHRYSGAPKTGRPAARVWHESDVAKFYENDRRGMYTPEQSAQLENEINEAVASGAVLQG